MSNALAAPPLTFPNVSFGPFRLMEAVPWLMLAAAMRLLAYGGGPVVLPAMLVASASLFLAFLLAARRMIELADGATRLGDLQFPAQLRLTGRVLVRVAALLVVGWLAAWLVAGAELAPHLLYGFDGIGFDQASRIGMAWSALLAAVVLLMVVQAGEGSGVSLRFALRELAVRARWLLPAILAMALFAVGVSAVQGGGHRLLWIFWQTSSAPDTVKNLVYLGFVVLFAALRLWGLLAILTVALRRSYRRTL